MATSTEVEESEAIFRQRMTDVVVSGHALVGLSLGVKLGLFKALASLDHPVTSDELAVRTDCKERYVREWLHHMVVCDVIDVDESGKTFTLPVHRRQALTGDSEIVTQRSSPFSFLLSPHTDVLSCFANDGPNGLPFEKVVKFMSEFPDAMREARGKVCSEEVVNSHPGMAAKLASGVTLLDVGCGKGHAILGMAAEFPNSKFIGVDLSPELLDEARKMQKLKGVNNAEFLLQNAMDMPITWYDTFDYVIMMDVLHDLAYPDKVLTEIYKCMKPGAFLSVVDINSLSNVYEVCQDKKLKEIGQIGYIVSIYHCLISSMYHSGSAALGTAPGHDKLTKIITDAKFTRVDGDTLKYCDAFNVHALFKK